MGRADQHDAETQSGMVRATCRIGRELLDAGATADAAAVRRAAGMPEVGGAAGGVPRVHPRIKFYLGTHMPNWLNRTDIPLFISARRLRTRARKVFPCAAGPWALDSGGFSELSLFGEWRTTAAQYLAEYRRWRSGIGKLEWAAQQDWMCEPMILRATGKTVEQHQELTINNFIELRSASLPGAFIPVLQGWAPDDYMRHLDMWGKRGVDLLAENLVGVGSVCRRQDTQTAHEIFSGLHGAGLRLHGFGLKIKALERYGSLLASADSMAWSYAGRRRRDPKHSHPGSCANCFDFAAEWYEKVKRCIRAKP